MTKNPAVKEIFQQGFLVYKMWLKIALWMILDREGGNLDRCNFTRAGGIVKSDEGYFHKLTEKCLTSASELLYSISQQ